MPFWLCWLTDRSTSNNHATEPSVEWKQETFSDNGRSQVKYQNPTIKLGSYVENYPIIQFSTVLRLRFTHSNSLGFVWLGSFGLESHHFCWRTFELHLEMACLQSGHAVVGAWDFDTHSGCIPSAFIVRRGHFYSFRLKGEEMKDLTFLKYYTLFSH